MFRKLLSFIFLILFLQGCSNSVLLKGQENLRAKNYPKSIELLTPEAESGNASAQYALGYMLYYGKGVPQNRPLALTWIQKAAAQGQPDAIKALTMIQIKSQDGKVKLSKPETTKPGVNPPIAKNDPNADGNDVQPAKTVEAPKFEAAGVSAETSEVPR